MCLTDKVVGDVEITNSTSIVKRCTVKVISSHWVTVLLIDEVLHYFQMIIRGSIV